MSDSTKESEVSKMLDAPLSQVSTRARRPRSHRSSGRRSSKSSVVKGFCVIICDFPPRMSEGRLRAVVEETVGCRVISCQMARNVNTGRLERAAQVVFVSRNEAMRAVHVLNRTSLDGERLTVRYRGMSIFTDKETNMRASRARAAALPTPKSRIRPAGRASVRPAQREGKVKSMSELAEEAKKMIENDEADS